MLRLRNIYIGSRRTTVRMENLLWDELLCQVQARGLTLRDACAQAVAAWPEANITSALRMWLVASLQQTTRAASCPQLRQSALICPFCGRPSN